MTYEEDPDYAMLKQNLLDGKRLPYREYLYVRCIYWIRNLASEKEMEVIQAELDQARFGEITAKANSFIENTSSNDTQADSEAKS